MRQADPCLFFPCLAVYGTHPKNIIIVVVVDIVIKVITY